MFPAKMYLAPKRIILIFGFLALVSLGGHGCIPASYVSPPEDEYVSDYDYLSDYGEWLEMPHYGLVWSPWVVADWAPFSNGHWSWTDDGWAWISYESFGWLVYHYGYWNFDRSVGWFWVPGTTWSPARVEWYTFGNYCGWAPMPPPDVYWPDPWYDDDVWIIVDINDFPEDNVGRRRIKELPRRDTIRRDDILKRPPAVDRVEEVTKRVLPTVKIERRRADVRSEVMKNPPKANRPRDVIIREMVLPEPDRTKVRERTVEVEREVLTPKKPESPEKRETPEIKAERDKPDSPEQKQREPQRQQPPEPPEKKTEDTQKDKVRRR